MHKSFVDCMVSPCLSLQSVEACLIDCWLVHGRKKAPSQKQCNVIHPSTWMTWARFYPFVICLLSLSFLVIWFCKVTSSLFDSHVSPRIVLTLPPLWWVFRSQLVSAGGCRTSSQHGSSLGRPKWTSKLWRQCSGKRQIGMNLKQWDQLTESIHVLEIQ